MADTHSPEEISDELGGVLSPARVRIEISRLVGERDWLTEAQEQQMLNIRLKKVISTLEKNAEISLDHAKVYLQYLRVIGERLDKAAARTEVDLNVLYANQARMMVQAFQLALAHMRGALVGEIDPEVWDASVREALEYAQAELSQYIPEIEA